jgi:hypothetical protein
MIVTRIAAAGLFIATVLIGACAQNGTTPAPTAAQPELASRVHALASKADVVPTLPPQGIYDSCEIDTNLFGTPPPPTRPSCEQDDQGIANAGFKWEINYIGSLMAYSSTAPGSQSLQNWFAYDTSIGLGQVLVVKQAINDPVNVLTGTSLVDFNGSTSLATSCGATNNEQIIQCIYNAAASVPNFNWKWYIYDEPGCPDQSHGYCQGTLAGGNYGNVATLAAYIESIDPTHQVIGTQIGDEGTQTEQNNLFSWLTNATTPVVGFDRYPIPVSTYGPISEIGTIDKQLATVIQANYSSEQAYFVGQAFSWVQEPPNACGGSITTCPYPTTAQMQKERDEALWYGSQTGGVPMSMVFWYQWPDITCLNSYTGCSSSANVASLKSAAFAPFPTASP